MRGSLFSLLAYAPLLPTLHIAAGLYPNVPQRGNHSVRYRDERLMRAAILDAPPCA